jgi:hypothetical protein
MGTIHIKEMTGGLDVRRLPETTPGGVLIRARDGHITRGGEFEKRAAFVPEFTLPAGTVGLAYDKTRLVVFGSGEAPALPTGVGYQRLQHPTDSGATLVRILSSDLYAGLIYAVGEFDDGAVYHFYDGVWVEDWYDGRARAAFRVLSGALTGTAAATATFAVTGGTVGGGNSISAITVNAVDILGGAVLFDTDNATTAAAVAAAITSELSSPEYTATADGNVVTITAGVAGTAANGRVLLVTPAGDVTVGSVTNFAGGTDAQASTLTGLEVAGVSIITDPVVWATDAEAMAAAIAAEINSTTSSPNYGAVASNDTVVVRATTQGAAPNGRPVTATVVAGLSLDISASTALSGGGTYGGAVASGSFDVVEGAGVLGPTLLPSINAVDLVAAPVAWVTDAAATAAAIVDAINSHTSTPNYTATVDGRTVTVSATVNSAALNGTAIEVAVTDAPPAPEGTKASGSFIIEDNGSLGGDDTLDGLEDIFGVVLDTDAKVRPKVDGVYVTSADVVWAGSAARTAAAVATAITSHGSTPNYTAIAEGNRVIVTAADVGTAANGRVVTLSTGGGLNATVAETFFGGNGPGGTIPSGGAYAEAQFTLVAVDYSATVDVKVGGVSISSGAVAAGAYADFGYASPAEFVAAFVNQTGSAFCARAEGTAVVLSTRARTDAHNGVTPTLETTGTITVGAPTAFADGADPAVATGPVVENSVALADGEDDDAYTPGTFVKTIRSKVYAIAGSLLHFSGIQEPAKWTTDTTGAGFINMAVEDADADRLTAIARYQDQLAIFAPTVTMIWFIDPDPDNNTLAQVLANTGTEFPRSVTQFGDSDVFYLDGSGLRSLRARDSSNAAATTDIGTPVDDLIVTKLEGMAAEDRRRVFGLINPIDKRFWLILKDEIYVFTFYQNAKVSAWSTYTLPFDTDAVVTFRQRPYLRSQDTIYSYGGRSGALAYDATEAEAWLPYLDANRPTAKKDWQALDVALTGLWEISAGMEPTNLDTASVVARIYETSFNRPRVPFMHSSSHLSLRFKSKGEGPAILSSAVIHYRGDEPEQ